MPILRNFLELLNDTEALWVIFVILCSTIRNVFCSSELQTAILVLCTKLKTRKEVENDCLVSDLQFAIL